MKTIARCGGYELVEDGPRLSFVDRGIGAHTIALFVLGLLTLIVGVNGAAQLALSLDGTGLPLLGAVLLAASCGLGLATRAVAAVRRARLEAPPGTLSVLARVDLERGLVEDGAGRTLAPLASARFRRAFQVGSSSRALELAHANGSVVIARGSPFHGGVDELEDALRARGLRVE